MKYPMSGVAGGSDGSPNELVTNFENDAARKIECMANGVPHAPGAAFRYLYGGGGGWGDPLKRDPEDVLDDVYDELVSLESAERDYGVVLEGSFEELSLAVDHAATKALRERKRPEAARSEAQPSEVGRD
jgi:N-methylhydantoinase B